MGYEIAEQRKRDAQTVAIQRTCAYTLIVLLTIYGPSFCTIYLISIGERETESAKKKNLLKIIKIRVMVGGKGEHSAQYILYDHILYVTS